jgi:GDP-6-deoxy-D-talose 4-dehydrogenase
MRIGVTGADGFTGRYLADALANQGAVAIPIEADLTDAAAVKRAVAETDFDRLVHLAGKAFVGSTDWADYYAIHVAGTFNLLDALAQRQPGMRCVLASSAQIYGPRAEGLIAETAAADPCNHYAVSKYAMERGAALWRDRLDLVVARPFNYTGHGQDEVYLIPKLVRHFRARAPSMELGNTAVARDFGDVRSVAEAYAGLVLAPSAPPVVNLATGAVTSVSTVMDVLADLSGHRPAVTVRPDLLRANDPAVLGGDVTLLRSALPDWQPRALSETLTWMYNADEGRRF